MFLALCALLIWALGGPAGLDGRLTALAYDPLTGAFPLKDHWWLARVGHEGLKWLMLAMWLACLAWRPLRRGALYMSLAVAAVALLKQWSPWSCPWDLVEWGGQYASPGPGRCLPAAHPAGGFALFGLYFALRRERPRAARAALAAAWLIGLAAGAVQVARGAHFATHVLWSAWVAWAVTLAAARLAPGRLSALPARPRRASPSRAGASPSARADPS
jgi:membrane-associated PAP2 superfamily phosphatase